MEENFRNKIETNNILETNEEGKSCLLFFDQNINPKTFYLALNQEVLVARLTGEENERKRVSKDLHDSLGQELNAIKLYMNALEQMDCKSDIYEEVLSDLKKMVDETIDSVREISFDCMPTCLEHGDLGKSVSQLLNRINRIQEGRITYQLPEEKINFECQSTLIFCYRIIQEFLNNSLKHSSATNIHVNIRREQNEFSVELKDNGCGHTIDGSENVDGLSNIINRLKALNARYQFYSKPNFGTTLIFTLNGK